MLGTVNSKFFKVLPEDEDVLFTSQDTVLSACLAHGIAVDHECGGNGACGTCRILMVNDPLSQPLTEMEQERSAERGFLPTERLSCQLQPTEGMIINRQFED
jgi:ferredoxin